jgi:hypothetical protein
VLRFNPRAQWQRFHAGAAARTEPTPTPQRRSTPALDDITDVVPRAARNDNQENP